MLSKQLTTAIAIFLSFAIFLSACSDNATGRKTSPTPVPTLVKYEPAMFTVERGSLISEKSISGEIVPSKQEILNFRTAGIVDRLTVKAGDAVKRGDLLAELQVSDQINQLQQARIDLEVAQSALEKAKIDRLYAAEKAQNDLNIAKARLDLAELDVRISVGVGRERAILNRNIADQNYNSAQLYMKQIGETTILKEEQVVARQKLAVDRLEALLADRQILAPIDGVILRVTISAGKQVTAFSPVIEIGDPAVLVIRAAPDVKIKPLIDETAEVQMSFLATFKEIHTVKYLPGFLPFNALEASKQQSFIQEYLYFSPPSDIPLESLKLGSTIYLNIIIGRRDNVLMLPQAAIRNYRGLNFVIVQDGDRRRRVEITRIGLQSNDRLEIEGDLQPGNRVFGQ